MKMKSGLPRKLCGGLRAEGRRTCQHGLRAVQGGPWAHAEGSAGGLRAGRVAHGHVLGQCRVLVLPSVAA